MFTVKNLGPSPKLRGMSFCPGAGLVSKTPKRVAMTPGLFGSLANAGRSVKSVSPFVSTPVVMLKGTPDEAAMNGAKRIPHGAVMDPPKNRRHRTSRAERPYSLLRSY